MSLTENEKITYLESLITMDDVTNDYINVIIDGILPQNIPDYVFVELNNSKLIKEHRNEIVLLVNTMKEQNKCAQDNPFLKKIEDTLVQTVC